MSRFDDATVGQNHHLFVMKKEEQLRLGMGMGRVLYRGRLGTFHVLELSVVCGGPFILAIQKAVLVVTVAVMMMAGVVVVMMVFCF